MQREVHIVQVIQSPALCPHEYPDLSEYSSVVASSSVYHLNQLGQQAIGKYAEDLAYNQLSFSKRAQTRRWVWLSQRRSTKTSHNPGREDAPQKSTNTNAHDATPDSEPYAMSFFQHSASYPPLCG